MIIMIIILSIVVTVEMFFMYKLARLIGEFLNRFQSLGEGRITTQYLQVGQKAPIINSKNQYNKKLDLQGENSQYKLLLFKDVNCATCKDISQQLPILISHLKTNAELIIIQRDKPLEEMLSKIQYFIDDKAFEDYRVKQVPTLFVVDHNGAILKMSNLIGSFDDLLEEISPFISLKVS
ncbi:TlpA family protein disulfide reductase [Bacillus toyonensis]|uniref:TlpA family protein disulfide reductase n=1 Tax=Bacillus toyonensis TaxID=155322 RepID=UPI0021759729|nr:thioredoxin-like domain-containing protein [Bacillus toyonensis]